MVVAELSVTVATPAAGSTCPGDSRNHRSVALATDCAAVVPAFPTAVRLGSEIVTVIGAPAPLMMLSSAPLMPM